MTLLAFNGLYCSVLFILVHSDTLQALKEAIINCKRGYD